MYNKNMRKLKWEYKLGYTDEKGNYKEYKNNVKEFQRRIQSFFNSCYGYEKEKKSKNARGDAIIITPKRGKIRPKGMLQHHLNINYAWIDKHLVNPNAIDVKRYAKYRELYLDAVDFLKEILIEQGLNNPSNFPAIKHYLNFAYNIKENLSSDAVQPIILHFNDDNKKSIVKFDNNINEFIKKTPKQ